MTIAIDIRNLRDQYGGIPEYTKNVVRHLISEGRDHHFILFYNGLRDPYFDIPQQRNVTVVRTRIPNKLFNPLLHFAKFPRLDTLIEKKAGRPIDLFFATDHNFFTFSKRALKKVLVVHDIGYHLFPYYLGLKGRLWIQRVAPLKLFKDIDHIIAVSRTTKNDLIRYVKIPEEKISVVYQGIDDSFFNSPNNERPLYEGDYIPLIGLSGIRKNAISIIQAFHDALRREPQLQTWRLVIVGDRKKLHDLDARINKLNLSKNILWRDYCTDAERLNMYRHAKLSIYPSFYEGFGLPPIEAMAVGVPTIVGGNSAMAEVSGPAALLVDSYHIGALTEALICLAKNDTVRARHIAKGLELSREFTWAQRARELLLVFEKISQQ